MKYIRLASIVFVCPIHKHTQQGFLQPFSRYASLIYRKAYSDIILLKRLGINIRAPYSTPVKGDKYKGIFELRTKFSSDITKIFYFLFNKNKFILLHGFVKKANRPPERELNKALDYKLDYESRCQDE